jgi:hypothetical protein
MLKKGHNLKNKHDSSHSSLQDNQALADILKSVSDDKSLSILQAIAAADTYKPNDDGSPNSHNNNEEIRLKELDLTTKQYYKRITTMLQNDLIKRHGRKYYLTPFGKVIYCCTMIAKYAIKNYYKLKAVEANEDSGFSNQEIGKLVDALIDNQQVKEFLAKKC